ncbi:MAG: hypothetical protein AAFW95_11270, partial [Cyanobacteria bacterium J06638_6]
GMVLGNGWPILLSGAVMIASLKISLMLLTPVFEGVIGRSTLEINRIDFRFERSFLGFRYKKIYGLRQDLGLFEFQSVDGRSHGDYAITLVSGAHQCRFGTLLSTVEKEWILQEINGFLTSGQ